jgi:leader peptidase (prepilin peptidase)/N-methyltransferase
MTTFLQYIGFMLLGYLLGGFVNFIVDWFYIRRKILEESIEEEILELGWVKYLVWPFFSKSTQTIKKIRILLVEIIFVGLVLWIGVAPPDRVDFWWGVLVLVYFAIVIVMDIEYRVVLHQISITGVVLGAVVGIYLWGPSISLIGGVVGFVIMYLLYKLGELFMRFVNKRRGEEVDEVALGFGDVNLSAVVGLFLGWPTIILGLLFAIFAGGIVSILFIVISVVIRRFKLFYALPYAPFLAIATIVILFFPDAIAALVS